MKRRISILFLSICILFSGTNGIYATNDHSHVSEQTAIDVCIYEEMFSEEKNEFWDCEKEIVYIDMTVEEWEESYTTNPAFINRKPNTVFRLNDSYGTRAICYNCGYASMTVQTEWRNMATYPVACPQVARGLANDMLYAHTGYTRDYCTSCGPLNDWGHITNPRYWNWTITCSNVIGDDLTGLATYKVVVGASVTDGYNPHRCIDIYDRSIVHGINCSCH